MISMPRMKRTKRITSKIAQAKTILIAISARLNQSMNRNKKINKKERK